MSLLACKVDDECAASDWDCAFCSLDDVCDDDGVESSKDRGRGSMIAVAVALLVKV